MGGRLEQAFLERLGDFQDDEQLVPLGIRGRIKSVVWYPVSESLGPIRQVTVDLYDGGSGGTLVFQSGMRSGPSAGALSMTIPGNGVLFEDGLYLDVTVTGGGNKDLFGMSNILVIYEGAPT